MNYSLYINSGAPAAQYKKEFQQQSWAPQTRGRQLFGEISHSNDSARTRQQHMCRGAIFAQ